LLLNFDDNFLKELLTEKDSNNLSILEFYFQIFQNNGMKKLDGNSLVNFLKENLSEKYWKD
jgi:hypothetical protein